MTEKCIIDIARYRGVLFDMDGVITETMPIHLEAWTRAFKPYGIDVEKMDVYAREGMTSKTMGKEIAEEKGKGLSRQDIENIVEEKGKIFNGIATEKAKAYPGVPETLRMLRNNGIKVALVTGSRVSSVKSVMDRVGLSGCFDALVTGDDVEKGKPDPEPYTRGMEKLNVERLNCIVVENAPLGIKSAKAAGAGYVIAVKTTLDESYLKEADDIMPSFSDLEQCLARRFADRVT